MPDNATSTAGEKNRHEADEFTRDPECGTVRRLKQALISILHLHLTNSGLWRKKIVSISSDLRNVHLWTCISRATDPLPLTCPRLYRITQPL